MFLCTCVILSLQHTGQGHSHKVPYTCARCDHRVAWGAKVQGLDNLRATGKRWARQLMVNRLYRFFKTYFGLYTHSRSNSLRDKASRNRLASAAAAVVPA